jgi:hypothetical protein
MYSAVDDLSAARPELGGEGLDPGDPEVTSWAPCARPVRTSPPLAD